MKYLVIGKTGQLGSELIQDLSKSNNEVLAPTENELDVTDKQSFLSAMKEFQPDIVINTAAYHNVPLCEDNPVKAFQVNCLAVKDMAEITSELDAWFVTFSTDYVFNGRKREPYIETDEPGPLQIYGLSKLAGEYAAISYPKSIIIRTAGLYGFQGAETKGGNFVDKRINDSKRITLLEMSNDQTVSPTFTSDLSEAVLKLVKHKSKQSGIYHLVNQGFCTWFEFTKEIFKIMDISIELIPVDRKGLTGKMRRPLFSALKNEKAAKMNVNLPHWKDGLKRYIGSKYLEKK